MPFARPHIDPDEYPSRWRRLALLPLIFAAGIVGTAEANARMPATDACSVRTAAGERYTVCSFEPGTRFSVRLRDGGGAPFRRLSAATAAHPQAVFAMNGGMYHSDLDPVGLYVEEGHEVAPLQTRRSWGNFGMLPNGVFWVDGEGRAHVTETLAFKARRERGEARPRFATQSGPMLVIDGRIHPRFLPRSDSRKVRNGVGVGRDGRVHFAISHAPVNFWTFADLFQSTLDVPNALFLDGTVSALRAKGHSRGGFWKELGPIILAEPGAGQEARD